MMALRPKIIKLTIIVGGISGAMNKIDENEVVTVPADYVLLSVRQSIDWGKLLEGSKVELGRGNTVIADSFTYQTAQPDVFVGGDAYSGPKFAIDAIAAGKEAAIWLLKN